MTTMHPSACRRYAMNAPVELSVDGSDTAAGLLIELTQETARISQLQPGQYMPGDSVTMKTPCGRMLDALVHSTSGCRAKVRFACALHLPELAELLDANRAQPSVV